MDPNEPFTALQISCLIVVVIASITDIKWQKIPNWLTFPAALVALVMQYKFGGFYAFIFGLAGWILAVIISVVLKVLPSLLFRYKAATIGFGDAKLLGAVGAFLGPHQIPLIYFYFCIFFGCLSVLRLLKAIPWNLVTQTLSGAPPAPLSPIQLSQLKSALKSQIPIAPAIALACLVTIVLGKQTLQILGFNQP